MTTAIAERVSIESEPLPHWIHSDDFRGCHIGVEKWDAYTPEQRDFIIKRLDASTLRLHRTSMLKFTVVPCKTGPAEFGVCRDHFEFSATDYRVPNSESISIVVYNTDDEDEARQWAADYLRGLADVGIEF